MSDISKLPLNLYKANLGLQVKLGRLFQESGRQWIDYGYRLVNDGIVESNAEAEALLTAEDWQKLATLPAESFWRQLQQRFGDSQAAAQIAITAQMHSEITGAYHMALPPTATASATSAVA